MKIPFVRGVIDRRILVNYKIDPSVLRSVLPAPLRPKLIQGVGMGGICLIRLKEVRPRLVPRVLGGRSENAAHRIAVSLPSGGEGVFIPRRDTSSRLNALTGGRVFPGHHHRSHFDVQESGGSYSLTLTDERRRRLLAVRAAIAGGLPSASVFASLAEASSFFEAGSVGYSRTADPSVLDGLELRTMTWHVEPLEVSEVYSGYFEDTSIFPEGSTEFDCALLMRGIEHEWHALEPLCCHDSAKVT
jgi:hypothetical protein